MPSAAPAPGHDEGVGRTAAADESGTTSDGTPGNTQTRAHPARVRRQRRLIQGAATALAVAGALSLAGCGGSGESTRRTGGGAVSVQSCGRTISFDSPPHRVVVVGASLSDTLFELGLGGRISALASADSTPDPKHREQLDALPSVGSPYPGKEALIASQPDLVITQQTHYMSGKNGAPSIDRLDKLGIPVYVAAGGCGDVDTDTAGVPGLFDDIRNYGTMFGVPDRAKALITRLEGALADVRARVAGRPKLRVAELSQVGGQVYATTGGPSQDVLARAGADNVFAGLPGQYTPLSAEQITARNPQAFVVQDFTASSAGKDIAYLKNTFPTTDAVENQRLLSIDASKAGAPGATRMVTGIAEIAKFLYPDAFAARSPSPSDSPSR